MAIKVNKSLTANSGLEIPSGSIIVPGVGFPRTISVQLFDEEGNSLGTYEPKRTIEYSISLFVSQQSFLEEKQQVTAIEIPSHYSMEMDADQHAAVLDNGMMAEVWLKNYLEELLGPDTCQLVDPFA